VRQGRAAERRPVFAPPTAQNLRVECGAKLRTKPTRAKRRSWSPSEEHREKLREALKQSPITGAGEANFHAKEWSLIGLDGTMHRFRNLALFVRLHGALFEPDDVSRIAAGRGFATRAEIYLSRLRPTGKPGHQQEWKGWRWLTAEVSYPDLAAPLGSHSP
jgi:hypothetical protein